MSFVNCNAATRLQAYPVDKPPLPCLASPASVLLQSAHTTTAKRLLAVLAAQLPGDIWLTLQVKVKKLIGAELGRAQ